MSDNVIWGTDFRAGRDEQPICNAPDVKLVELAANDPYWLNHTHTHAPTSYDAPDGDCA